MFEAFTWMFKKENFKKHYVYLIVCAFLSNLAVILLMAGKITSIIFITVAALFMLFIGLFLCGYFWKLCENIINAETDISANTVYNGKIKTFLKIDLPEIKIFKLIWRGVASIIANFLMLIPYFLLMGLSAGLTAINPFAPTLIPIIMLFYLLFIPALLWNYAKNNSVFSALNIPKAIYIMGNYPGRYIAKIFQMGVIYILNVALALFLASKINLFAYIVMLPVTVYISFVYAYLLGTLVPNEEF